MRDIVLTAVFFGILPFVFSRPYIGIYLWTWLGFMNPHRLTWGFAYNFPFAEITAIVTLISLLKSKEPKQIPWTRETVLLFIFILWMLFTTFFAFHPDLAWQQWDKIWKIQLMIYISIMIINDKQKLDWLVWVIVLSLGFYGVKGGLFTILHGGIYHVQGPPRSFIYGNNEIGLALTMTIPLMRYLQLQANRTWIYSGLVVAMVLTSIAAIGSQSRGALVGILAMGSFLILKSRNKLFMLLAIFVIVGATATIMPEKWYQRMATIETYQQDQSALGRINAWWTAYNVAKDRITGGGFETFKPDVFRLYAPEPKNVHDAHSIYFEVMGEHGFIGLSLFLLLGWFTWNKGTQIKRLTRQKYDIRWASDLARMVQTSLVGYAVCGLFLGLAYFDYYYTLIAIMVICKLVVEKQLANAPASTTLERKQITEMFGQNRPEFGSLTKK